MTEGKFNKLWQTDRNPDLPLDIDFTGLAVTLLRASQNLHSMLVVQPEKKSPGTRLYGGRQYSRLHGCKVVA